MTRLTDSTWNELARGPLDTLLVPIGSTEQHGPHLPLDTDTRIATAVTDRVERLRPAVAVAPAIPLGASGEHADFPGTLSIGTEALQHLVVELVRDAGRDWRHVVVVNGHGGNVEALRAARTILTEESRRLTNVHLGRPGMDAHAGRAETSIMLHLDPDRVRMERATVGETAPVERLLDRLRTDGVRAVSGSGVLGDPTGASAAEGVQWVEALVSHVLEQLG